MELIEYHRSGVGYGVRCNSHCYNPLLPLEKTLKRVVKKEECNNPPTTHLHGISLRKDKTGSETQFSLKPRQLNFAAEDDAKYKSLVFGCSSASSDPTVKNNKVLKRTKLQQENPAAYCYHCDQIERQFTKCRILGNVEK